VLSLSLEVTRGTTTQVYTLEPKIRDEFLQALFDYANAGGFSGNYTEGNKMQILRDSLLETAKKVLGPIVFDVLVTGIMRQDV
ncbi:MAG: flagellar basal body-associated protein FliL, partial [Paracoccaceae bacterium]|nr:flagellar basal body-associated protein FliL [Paracoccaceae bacterium]